jgi:hypothetical protein
MDDGVVHDFVFECLEILPGREITVDEQIRYLEEGRVLRELLNRIATITEHFRCVFRSWLALLRMLEEMQYLQRRHQCK